MRWQVYRLARLIGKVARFQHRGTHWWAATSLYQKQRNRSGLNNWLDCLALWRKPSKIGSQLLLASTNSNILLGRGSEKTFIECLRVNIPSPYEAWVQYWLLIIKRWQVYRLARLVSESCSVSKFALQTYSNKSLMDIECRKPVNIYSMH